MSPETREFLRTVRRAEGPEPGDERRVLAAVHAALTVGAVAGTAAGASKAAKLFGISGLSALKLGVLLLAVVGSVGLGARAWDTSTTRLAADADLHRTAPVKGAAAKGPPLVTSGPKTSFGSPASMDPPKPRLTAGNGIVPDVRAAPPKAASLRDEIELLAAVRAALERGDGAEAMRRLDEHRTFDRQFAAERRAARVLALCSLGRTEEARAQASAFLHDFPSSVQRAAVERSCAAEKTTLER
jgi:RNA polymerase sigma-70 factor (ECF subfamily)